MILATTKIEDIDRFLDVFSTKGAEKRAEHGSKGSTVFRDPTEEDRVWAVFDWDEDGWAAFVSDPDVPPIPPHATWYQLVKSTASVVRGDSDRVDVIKEGVKSKLQEVLPGGRDE